MAVSVRILFDTPQRETASVLSELYARCRSASLVSGFMTVEGIEAIAPNIREYPSKLAMLVVGAATYRAFDAFDQLLGMGVQPNRLRVHLGHSRPTSTGARYGFYRYHPMLHSKVYLFELPGGKAAALVGSHNLTGFALHGLNGEAGTLIEGEANDAPFADLRSHVATAVQGAVLYDPTNREAYAWWAKQFMDGLAGKSNDSPRDGQAARTVVILAEADPNDPPSAEDVIYFELPSALLRVSAMNTEFHVYLFDALPASPLQALVQLSIAHKTLWCKTIGLEDDRGGRELRADWHVDSPQRPVLKRAPRPFRPTPCHAMQQVRIQAHSDIFGAFEYLFDPAGPAFEPVFDREQILQLAPDRQSELEALKLVPPENLPWFRVVGLRREPVDEDAPYRVALREFSPQSGAFIVMSLRRRSRKG